MEAAKKADREFCCYQSGKHTTRDSDSDIKMMMDTLLESCVTCQQQDRKTPAFVDPTNSGMDKLFNTDWVKTTLSRMKTSDESDLQGNEDSREDIDLNYELSDIN